MTTMLRYQPGHPMIGGWSQANKLTLIRRRRVLISCPTIPTRRSRYRRRARPDFGHDDKAQLRRIHAEPAPLPPKLARE